MAMVRGQVLAPVLSAKPDVIPNTVTHCSTGGPQQQVVTGPLLTPSQIAFTGPVRLGVRLSILISKSISGQLIHVYIAPIKKTTAHELTYTMLAMTFVTC